MSITPIFCRPWHFFHPFTLTKSWFSRQNNFQPWKKLLLALESIYTFCTWLKPHLLCLSYMMKLNDEGGMGAWRKMTMADKGRRGVWQMLKSLKKNSKQNGFYQSKWKNKSWPLLFLLTPPVWTLGCCWWSWPRPINNESQKKRREKLFFSMWKFETISKPKPQILRPMSCHSFS